MAEAEFHKKSSVNENFVRFWFPLWEITRRDIRVRYRRSALGPAWMIIQPLLLMTVFMVVKRVLDIPSDGIPYILFSYSVLVPWVSFTMAVSSSSTSILSNASILKKMSIPREIFPLAGVTAQMSSMLFSGVILAGIMVWFRVPVGWSLLWLPVLILMTGCLAFGVGLLLAALGTYKQDFILVNTFLTQVWLYLTPVIYPLSSVPENWRPLYILNPMVGILEGFRDVLARGQAPDTSLLGWALLGVVLTLGIGLPLFRKSSQYFADVL